MKPDSRVDAGAPLEVPFRQLLHGWIWLCLIAALGWAATIAWARTMGVGPGTMGMSLAAFLFLWVVMMAAMMFPSVAPMALVWIRSLAARPRTQERVAGITSFLAGYLCAWATFGAAVYLGAWVRTGKRSRFEAR